MKQRLNVRGLPPPVPMTSILDALCDLAEHDWLSVVLSRDPFPLYPILLGMGYRWRTIGHEDDRIEVLIWPAAWGDSPPLSDH